MTTKIETKEGRKETRNSLFEGRTKSIVLSLWFFLSYPVSVQPARVQQRHGELENRSSTPPERERIARMGDGK